MTDAGDTQDPPGAGEAADEAEPIAPSAPSEPPVGPPDYSILIDDRLVAYVWTRADGKLRRAGKRAEILCDVPFAEIQAFDRKSEDVMRDMIASCDGVDALNFKLGMQGYRIEPGPVTPYGQLRRF